MTKFINFVVIWSLPDNTEKIRTEYSMKVPKGITSSFYLWLAVGMKISYKNYCFVNILKTFIKQKNNQKKLLI